MAFAMDLTALKCLQKRVFVLRKHKIIVAPSFGLLFFTSKKCCFSCRMRIFPLDSRKKKKKECIKADSLDLLNDQVAAIIFAFSALVFFAKNGESKIAIYDTRTTDVTW